MPPAPAPGPPGSRWRGVCSSEVRGSGPFESSSRDSVERRPQPCARQSGGSSILDLRQHRTIRCLMLMSLVCADLMPGCKVTDQGLACPTASHMVKVIPSNAVAAPVRTVSPNDCWLVCKRCVLVEFLLYRAKEARLFSAGEELTIVPPRYPSWDA